MSKHRDFILTPIEGILNEVPLALRNIDKGFETYALYEYVMQSVFLKMTGFQEQKMKCICWEIATDDYEYRYKRYKRKPLGECSDISEKNIVWDDLVEHVISIGVPEVDLLNDDEKTRIIDETKKAVDSFYIETAMEGWAQKEYSDYLALIKNCSKECLCFKSKKSYELLGHCDNCIRKKRIAAEGSICMYGTLADAYKKLYTHRNRCAHNTHSYQHNLPSLQTMSDQKYVFENYFLHFAILIMIDKMIVCLFKKYLKRGNIDFLL